MDVPGRGQGGRKIEELRQIEDREGDIFEPAPDDVLRRGISDDQDPSTNAFIAQDKRFVIPVDHEKRYLRLIKYARHFDEAMPVRIALKHWRYTA